VQVRIGNSAAKEAYRDEGGGLHHRPVDGARVTTVNIPDSYTFLEMVTAITAADGVWNHHSQGDNVADSTPDWVDADDQALATVLGAALNCPVGRPAKWKGLG
jgi:hypothetical protein